MEQKNEETIISEIKAMNFEGMDVDDAVALLEEKYGEDNVEFVDEKIDDGGDEEGEYVMMRLYCIHDVDIRFYYSDCDNIIGYCEVR